MQNGLMMIVGGPRFKPPATQISIVENCGLRRIGDLPFEFNYGACNTFKNEIKQEIALLCFHWDDKDACWNFNGNDVSVMGGSANNLTLRLPLRL